MDKRNPKQTCSNCAYYTYDKKEPWGENRCYFPLSPTEEPDGVYVSPKDSCSEWAYRGQNNGNLLYRERLTATEVEKFRDAAIKIYRLEEQLGILKEKVHGLEQVITDDFIAALVTRIENLSKDRK